MENLERSVYADKSNNDRQCSLALKHSNCTMGVVVVSILLAVSIADCLPLFPSILRHNDHTEAAISDLVIQRFKLQDLGFPSLRYMAL